MTCHTFASVANRQLGTLKVGFHCGAPTGLISLFFPYPVVDVRRPWGGNCDQCSGKCTGHYVTNIGSLLQLHKDCQAVRSLPPSVISEEAYKDGVDTEEEKIQLARKCCLAVDDVSIWIDHIRRRDASRQKGVEKARVTRAKKKQAQNVPV